MTSVKLIHVCGVDGCQARPIATAERQNVVISE